VDHLLVVQLVRRAELGRGLLEERAGNRGHVVAHLTKRIELIRYQADVTIKLSISRESFSTAHQFTC
jgi:hypothetical protein